jgi:hypothetical protein
MQVCQRCGSTGTAQPFQGAAGGRPGFHRISLRLCSECRLAHEAWLRYRLRLEMGDRTHLGRADLVTEAKAVWGGRATDMLALLLVARDSMDAASRLLPSRSFEQIRPWLEASLDRNGEHEGATSGGPQTGTVRSPVGQGATPRLREAADSQLRGYPREHRGPAEGSTA